MGSKNRLIIAAITALACAALSAAAGAQVNFNNPLSSVPPTREQAKDLRRQLDPSGELLNPTTQLIPATGTYDIDDTINPKPPKDTELWIQQTGAQWGQRAEPEGTPVPHEVDFHAVRFRNGKDGFAAGSVCKDEVDTSAGTDAEFKDALAGCERVPVIYAQTQAEGWHRSYRSSSPGYVGAIAWIRKGVALAVGGGGSYPRRELARRDGESYADWVSRDETEGAGMARAWLYRNNAWSEITGELPSAMRALTALDVWVGKEQAGNEFGVAGALGQLWEWRDGHFTGKLIDKDSVYREGESDPPPDTSRAFPSEGDSKDSAVDRGVEGAEDFLYRVREVKIAPDRERRWVFASTAGCCGESGQGAKLVSYVPRRNEHRRDLVDDGGTPIDPDDDVYNDRWVELPHWRVTSLNDRDGDGVENEAGDVPADQGVYSFGILADGTVNWQNDPNLLPDGAPAWRLGGVVSAPDGAEPGPGQPPEPALRLVAASGDIEQRAAAYGGHPAPPPGDGVPDWKAGAYLRSDAGLGARGLLETTVENLRPEFGGLRPYCQPPKARLPTNQGYLGGEALVDNYGNDVGFVWICRTEQIQAGKRPYLDERSPIRQRERGEQLAPTYALNAVAMVDAEGIGYAVGDRGAILRSGASAVEVDPAPVGARREAKLTERSPYEGLRPPSAAKAGEVPPLAARPREQLERPALVPWGSPDDGESTGGRARKPLQDVHTIAMSRDGSEGWAFGPSREASSSAFDPSIMTVFHYTGGQWRRCDFENTDLARIDPACAELQPFYEYDVTQAGGGLTSAGANRIQLLAAGRVPLENDTDPTNDEEFELLAIGTGYWQEGEPIPPSAFFPGQLDPTSKDRPTVLRYHNGHWRLAPYAMRDSLYRAHSRGASGVGNSRNTNPQHASTSESGGYDLAFAAPGEGWLRTPNSILHLIDDRWVDCEEAPDPADCGDDPEARRLFGTAEVQRVDTRTLTVAGSRLYLGGRRAVDSPVETPIPGINPETALGPYTATTPFVLYKDLGLPCAAPGDPGCWRAEEGGFDPGFDRPGDKNASGEVQALAVAKLLDGHYEGWALGNFGGSELDQSLSSQPTLRQVRQLNAARPLMRLAPGSADWREFDGGFDPGYAFDTPDLDGTEQNPGWRSAATQLVLPGGGEGPSRALIAERHGYKIAELNTKRERWQTLEDGLFNLVNPRRRVMAMAPDGEGGAWVAAATGSLSSELPGGRSRTYFYRYTDRPPKEVFAEAPHPLAGEARSITALAGSPDGALWLASDSADLYRYERALGWERVRVPGWDPGKVLTRSTPVKALAVNAQDVGLAVGEGGKIARLSARGVSLDPAAGTVCDSKVPIEPCGTSFDLTAVDVALDGSAIAGGAKVALLWRPAGGELRTVEKPDTKLDAEITGVSMPSAKEAYLTTDTGQVFRGELADGEWSWRLEAVDEEDALLARDANDRPIALRDVEVDASGHGYAIGDQGVVLERTEDREPRWRRLDAGLVEDLTSVALPAGEGSGALIGGKRGLILTFTGGGWQVARPADSLRLNDGAVVGLALLPGVEDGQVEAWAAVEAGFPRRSGTTELLHFASEESEPLLDPLARGAVSLADAPAPRPGELSIGAFGRSDCHERWGATQNLTACPHFMGSGLIHERIARRVRDALIERRRRSGLDLALHTGDAFDTASATAQQAIQSASPKARLVHSLSGFTTSDYSAVWAGVVKYASFTEQILDPLQDAGLESFGALGARDLSETRVCKTGFDGTAIQLCAPHNRDRLRAGENLAWRQAFENRPAPWGKAKPASSNGLRFKPVSTFRPVELENQRPVETGTALAPAEVPLGGAHTHYALDVEPEHSGERQRLARLVVLDTSQGSLAASDTTTHPFEPDGGQLQWLEKVLCESPGRSPTGERCTRRPGEPVVVLSSVPTYTYGQGAADGTQADGAALEAVLMRYGVSTVVSGRLGYNARYWATAPGLHEPCPTGDYTDQPPSSSTARLCGRSANLPVSTQGAVGAGSLADALDGIDSSGAAQGLISIAGGGLLPFVVAGNSGGRFGPDGSGSGEARDGYWRGYSVIRVPVDGDPRKLLVEQRPIYDWVGITAQEHTLRAGQKMTLRGLGREPIGSRFNPAAPEGGGRYDRLDGPAITHRYDLVEADPARPWLPKQGEKDSPYAPLDPSIATVDTQSGVIKVGRGNQPRTYAIGMLSVGCVPRDGSQATCDPEENSNVHVATWPLVFEPRRTFRPVVAVQPKVAQIKAQAQAALPQPPNPPQPPAVKGVDLPAPPGVPVPPPVNVPSVNPPSPPIPPPPPVQQSPVPLDLSASAPTLQIAPQTTVIPPPAPPIQPAPPGGARREARQRQSATQSSGSGADTGSETQHLGGDLANSSDTTPGSAMTRVDRTRADGGSMTALYGGGVTLLALVTAFGWNYNRPGPRRRSPVVPAPARAWNNRRRY